MIVTTVLMLCFLSVPTTRMSSFRRPAVVSVVSMNYTRSEFLGDFYGFVGGGMAAQIAFDIADADRRAKLQSVENSLELLQEAEKERQSPERLRRLPR